MKAERVRRNYRLASETIDYIEKIAKEKGISRERSVDFIINEHKKANKTSVWIYVNILDTKKLSPFQNNIHSWSVLYPAKPVK